MVEHLPFNDFDMAGVSNAVTRYKEARLQANYSVDDREKGIIRIAFQHPELRDGSIVIFDIHKIAKKGFFRTKAWWVIQLHSKTPGEEVKQHGCVFAPTQAHVIHTAEVDLKYGFTSICSFEMAADTSSQ